MTESMGARVAAFLDELEPDQRRQAVTAFDVADHRVWTYLPGERPGLMLADIRGDQREVVLSLLDSASSESGAMTARAVIDLDLIRRRLDDPDAHGDRFWVRVLGDPGGDRPWAWRLNGHHLAVHVTVVGRDVAVTPNFFGAEPAVVPSGPHQGLRVLPAEEELARSVLARLDRRRRSAAVVAAEAPNDILTRHDPVADPDAVPLGVPWRDLDARQQDSLGRLVRLYFDRAPPRVADEAWSDAVHADLGAITFAWAGPVGRGHGHYYAVRGPTFLIEYDNTQDDANHIHSVWRDLRRDWGGDVLAAHYADGHR